MELNALPFKSLLKGEVGQCWYPKPVEVFRPMLNIYPSSENDGYMISKNIAYNLQYVEYLQKQINELCLSEVLLKMVRKNYIITAMGIVEGLFVFLLRSTGNWNTSEWQQIGKSALDNAQSVKVGDKTIKVQHEVFEHVDKFEVDMNLDTLIQKIEKKRLLQFDDEDTFNVLAHLRKLRNRVHLHVSYSGKTEYADFTEHDQRLMKRILFSILTRPQFCADPNKAKEIYDFLLDKQS